MATVRKRVLASGRIVWQFDYRDKDGHRRHRQFSKKADALAYETHVRSALVAGTHVANAASITLQAAGQHWIQRAEREGLEAGTIRQYRQHLDHHILPFIGQRKLSTLSTPDIEGFRDELVKTRSRPLSRAVLTSLKGVFKEAKRRGLIGHNPALETSVKMSKRDKERTQIPSKDEIRLILARSAELWPLVQQQRTRRGDDKRVPLPWQPFLIVALFTGLRSSELRGLVWDNVDFKEGCIKVRQRADFRKILGPPKSHAGNREVPMAPLVRRALLSWKLVCQTTSAGLVFPTENGTIHANENIHRVFWRPLMHAIGLPSTQPRTSENRWLKFHSLRHAAASLFIEQGWSPKKVQVVMGHSSIQVTFDTYGHLWKNVNDDLAAMAQIEARLLGHATDVQHDEREPLETKIPAIL